MPEKKKRDLDISSDAQKKQRQQTHTTKDLLEYDPEKQHNLIDVEDAAEHAGQVNPPARENPERTDEGVPPGQENVSQGFTTGRGMQGGSANRRKRS